MKISGFTIIRNALINDYPIREAICSILPVVDEMVVLVGKSDDNTLDLIRSIDSPKIRIHESEWDMSLRNGGVVLAVETDKALKLVDPTADWCFYIQGDEAVHEKYHPDILQACREHLSNHEVEGLVFDYVHFYGSYDYVGDSRTWYRNEVRIIRNHNTPPISAYRDAQGFRKGKEKIRVKPANAAVYHYGWVKSPAQMRKKLNHVGRYWNDDQKLAEFVKAEDIYDFSDFDSLARFEGTHPACMLPRIAEQNWNVELDTSRKKFSVKERILYWIEKSTGKRLFEFRNFVRV